MRHLLHTVNCCHVRSRMITLPELTHNIPILVKIQDGVPQYCVGICNASVTARVNVNYGSIKAVPDKCRWTGWDNGRHIYSRDVGVDRKHFNIQ